MEDRKVSQQAEHQDANYEIRWDLFSYIINPEADPELFKAVPKEDLIMVCKLYHMQNERRIPLLYEYEVKAFILTHLKVDQKEDFDLKIFVPEPRTTQLTTIYKFKILNLINATIGTLFENYSKCRIWSFEFWHFPPIFVLFKTDLSGNTVWPQASGFQKLAKMDHFWHF